MFAFTIIVIVKVDFSTISDGIEWRDNNNMYKTLCSACVCCVFKFPFCPNICTSNILRWIPTDKALPSLCFAIIIVWESSPTPIFQYEPMCTWKHTYGTSARKVCWDRRPQKDEKTKLGITSFWFLIQPYTHTIHPSPWCLLRFFLRLVHYESFSLLLGWWWMERFWFWKLYSSCFWYHRLLVSDFHFQGVE